jgi:hypothetical protein
LPKCRTNRGGFDIFVSSPARVAALIEMLDPMGLGCCSDHANRDAIERGALLAHGGTERYAHSDLFDDACVSVLLTLLHLLHRRSCDDEVTFPLEQSR